MGSNTGWIAESPRRWVPALACREALLDKALFYFHPAGRCCPDSDVAAGSHKT